VAALAAALVAATQGGCASWLKGSEQAVEIRSEPPGATATVLPEGRQWQTPATVVLARRHVHTVFFEFEGHCPEIAYLDRVTSPVMLLDALLLVIPPVGAMAIERDKQNHAQHRLRPDPLVVALRPIDPSAGEDACRAPRAAEGAAD
jgi:hypothetical protein